MGTIHWVSEQTSTRLLNSLLRLLTFRTLLGRKCLLGLTEDLLTASLESLGCMDLLAINSVI